MATIGLAFVTIVLAGLAIRSERFRNKATLAVFWGGYAAVNLVFAGVL
jgi:putative hemolysin